MGEHGPARWTGSGKRSVRATSQSAAPSEAPAPAEPEATDAAKALAAEYGIDLSTVAGTGADGRVTKEDVAALIPVEETPAVEVEEPPAETPAEEVPAETS